MSKMPVDSPVGRTKLAPPMLATKSATIGSGPNPSELVTHERVREKSELENERDTLILELSRERQHAAEFEKELNKKLDGICQELKQERVKSENEKRDLAAETSLIRAEFISEQALRIRCWMDLSDRTSKLSSVQTLATELEEKLTAAGQELADRKSELLNIGSQLNRATEKIHYLESAAQDVTSHLRRATHQLTETQDELARESTHNRILAERVRILERLVVQLQNQRHGDGESRNIPAAIAQPDLVSADKVPDPVTYSRIELRGSRSRFYGLVRKLIWSRKE